MGEEYVGRVKECEVRRMRERGEGEKCEEGARRVRKD